MEMRTLWLFEDCYNHLARGDYNRSANSKMAASRFVNVFVELINTIEDNSIAKSSKVISEFSGTFFKSNWDIKVLLSE